MKEEEVRKILVVQSVEQIDEKGEAVSNTDRTEAAAIAGAPLPKDASDNDQHAFLSSRADVLVTRLASRFPEATDWLLSSPPKHRLGLLSGVLLLLAATVGYLTNELGPDKRINILSFPLLGILLWNLLVYLKEIIQFFRHRDNLFNGFWTSACVRFIADPETQQLDHDSDEKHPLNAARKLYDRRWYDLQFPVLGSRIKSLLHFVAMTLAAAAIGGMYVKGLASEYRAVWESTFIENASQLQPFLRAVLGPAIALSGDSFPSLEELSAMHWQSSSSEVAGENAARWIHWYAISIGLFVILPRIVLGLIWRIRSSRLLRTLPYREVCPHYSEHLLAISTGSARRLQIIPYSLTPDDETKQRVVTRMESAFKSPVEVEWLSPIPFGSEEDPADLTLDSNATAAILFNFASTPESETHLALHQTLSGQAPNPVEYLILDTKNFDLKASDFPDSAKRRSDRLEAWQRLFSGANNVHFLLTADESVASSSSDT